MTTTTISSGHTVSFVTISNGDTEIVMAGGVSLVPTVSSGGALVLEGGSASSASLLNGAALVVSSGGQATDLSASSGASATVLSGGLVERGVVVQATLTVSGGAISGVGIEGGSGTVIGGKASDTQLDFATLSVFSGGFAGNTFGTPDGGEGTLVVGARGSASGVSGLGTIEVDSGGSVSFATLSHGKSETVSPTAVVASGGMASHWTLISAASVTVEGEIVSTTLSGSRYLESGYEPTIQVEKSGVADATKIDSGGVQDLVGGTANRAVITSEGQQIVYSGGVANHTIIRADGEQVISSGGVARATVISGYGTEVVSSGGIASGAVVLSHGDEEVLSGGLAVDPVVHSGGFLDIQEGGEVYLGSGMAPPFSSLFVYSAKAVIRSGVAVSGFTVGATATLVVSSGGQAIDARVLSGGTIAFAGGTATSLSYVDGAREALMSGVTSNNVVIDKGLTLIASSGSTVSGARVLSGATIELAGGKVTGLSIGSGGQEAVGGGVTVSGLVLDKGIGLVVSSGGTASQTVVQSGSRITFAGGQVSGLIVESGGSEAVIAGGVINGQRIGSGIELVASSLGSVENTTILAGGTILMQDFDGQISNLVIEAGGHALVGSGAELLLPKSTISGHLTVLSGGTIYADGRGIGSGTSLTLSSGAKEVVDLGASISGQVVNAGAELIVSSRGTATDTTLLGGSEVVSSGARIAGTTVFGRNADLSVAIVDAGKLTVSGFKRTDTIDLTTFQFHASENLSFVENKARTCGILKITDGSLQATVTLLGEYVAAGFHVAKASADSTAITYAEPHSASTHLAVTPG